MTTVLCLPSLLGGAALLTQALLYRDISQWQETPSALIAFGSLLGGPLVTVAAAVGAVIAFSRLSTPIKYAHLIVVGLAAVATIALLFRFAK